MWICLVRMFFSWHIDFGILDTLCMIRVNVMITQTVICSQRYDHADSNIMQQVGLRPMNSNGFLSHGDTPIHIIF